MVSKKEKFMLAAVKISLAGNAILFTIKAVTLVFVNSVAVMADLGISLVALVVSVILYHTVRLANRPADIIHNYGYGKVEHVCEALEGIAIIGIAFAMVFQAITTLIHHDALGLPWIGLATSAIGIIINTIGGFYILRMAKMSGSPSIHAEALHYFLEAFISFSITMGFLAIILLSGWGYSRIAGFVDPAVAIFVSVVISIPSIKLAREAFVKLLDSSMEEPSKLEVIKCLSAYMDNYCEFKDIKSRVSGTKKFIELKLVLPEHMAFKKGHDIVEMLEKDIKGSVPNSEVIIKMEPCLKDCVHMKKNRTCPYIKLHEK